MAEWIYDGKYSITTDKYSIWAGNARKAAESFADRDFREIAEHIGILKHSEALSYRYL